MRVAVGFGLVTVAVVAVGWLQSPPDITGAEAVRAARGAFRAADIADARVDPHPRAGTYRPADAAAPLPVWRTSTRVPGGSVELWLAREDGEPVFLDDRSGDGAVQLLSDAQFQALAEHYENPATGRQVRRNLLLTVAAALVTAMAVQWDLQRTRLRRRRPASDPHGLSAPAAGGPASSVPAPPVPAPPVPAPAAVATAVAAPVAPALPFVAVPTGAAVARPPARSVPLRAAPPRPDRPLRAREIP